MRALTITLSGSETVQVIANTGDITIDGVGTSSTVNIWGTHSDITNTASGSPTVTDEGMDTGDIADILVDTGTTIPSDIAGLNDLAATDIVSSGQALDTTLGVLDVVTLVDTTTDVTNAVTPDNAADTTAILEDTGTTLPARFTGVEGATFDTATDSLEAFWR